QNNKSQPIHIKSGSIPSKTRQIETPITENLPENPPEDKPIENTANKSEPQSHYQWFVDAINRCTTGKKCDINTQFQIGVMFFKGDGVPQDRSKAVEWFKIAESHGHPQAKKALELIDKLNSLEDLVNNIETVKQKIQNVQQKWENDRKKRLEAENNYDKCIAKANETYNKDSRLYDMSGFASWQIEDGYKRLNEKLEKDKKYCETYYLK
ncbi:MAG: sel1 repeat family protein, partial [Nitrospirae bacterium]|nr:sel1 repeat family protein [Nitrospirota bacterium]